MFTSSHPPFPDLGMEMEEEEFDEDSPPQSAESYFKHLGGSTHFCLACGYKSAKGDMRKHVERKHMRKEYPCTMCSRVSRSEVDRRIHYGRVHKLNLSNAEIAGLKSFRK